MWSRQRIGISMGAGQMALAAVHRRGESIVVEKTATEALAAGLCRPSPIEKNIGDVAQWQRHVGALLGRFSKIKIRAATLSLPDTAVRTLLITLQQVPARRADFEKLIQWHMEKTFLHPLGEARFSHQILSRDAAGIRLLTTAVKQEVVQQYETFNGAGAGIEIDRVGPSSLLVFNLFRPAVDRLGARHFLFVRIFDQILTLMIFESGLPTFIRTKDFPESEAWDEMLISELTTSLSFYEGSGHTMTTLTHLLWSAGAEYAPTPRLREVVRLTVVHLDPRSVFQAESFAPEIVAAVAAAAA